MKPIRYLSCIFAVIGLLLALPGCGTQLPSLEEATSTPALTGLSEAALIERALSAVQALAHTDGLSYDLQSTTLTRAKVTVGENTLSEGSHLEAMTDQGTWSMQGEQANVALQRKVSYPGSNLYSLRGEMRLVDGQVYLYAAFDEAKADLPAMPEGWLRVNGESTLLYWPNIQELAIGYSLQDIHRGPWPMLAGYPVEVLDEIFSDHLDTAQHGVTTLTDGSAGEILTFKIKSSTLKKSIRYLGEPNPAYGRALASVQGSPITMNFTLDEENRLVEWKLAIKLEVQDVDLTGTPGAPEGAKLEGGFEQNVSAQLWRDPPPAAVAAPSVGEIARLPAYSGVGGSPLFQSLEDFDVGLNQAFSDGTLDTFWQQLASAKTMPLVFGDLAVFLYRGEGESVAWIADWNYNRPYGIDRLNGSNLWMHTVHLPEDARLEYQIQVDSGELMLDPLNPDVEVGGLGSKSVVQMPGYTPPEFVLPSADVAPGTLTTDTPFSSQSLGYEVNYRVYTPAEYASLHQLPVLYVTDGQDFLAFGKLAVALDNLIASGRIRPVIAVFIDPRNVKTGENQRDQQFFDNTEYGKFIAEELVPEIDRIYRTDPSPDARLILGTSNGGYHSIYFALNHSDIFHLVVAFSPSIWHNPEIIETYRQTESLPLKFFISTGVFNDSDYHTRPFQDMLKGKGYALLYIESNEGHSYGNWRGKFDEMLEFFFPAASDTSDL